MTEGKLLVIEAKQVEDSGVEIVDVDRIFNDGIGNVVGFAVNHAAFDTAPSEPG